MIVTMYKYSFLLFHRDYLSFLEELRDAGVLHIIERPHESSEETRKKLSTVNQLKETIRVLEQREQEDKKQSSDRDGQAVLNEVSQVRADIDNVKQEINSLKKLSLQVQPWGDFDPELIDKLNKNGIDIRFFSTTDKRFNEEWLEMYPMEVIRQDGVDIYFVVFDRDGLDLDIDAEEMEKPEMAIGQIEQEIHRLEEKKAALEQKLDEHAVNDIPALQKKANEIQEQLDFEMAINSGEKEAEDSVILLEGWVPEDREDELKKVIQENDVVSLKAEAKEIVENPKEVPVVLKNNKFAKLFEPIGNLFSLPNVSELDMTPFFAPFFALFFGFCLGDAGYGLLFIIAATIVKPKVKKEMKPILTLLQILGSTTVLFGAITGTLFGISLASEENQLLTQYKDQFLTNQQMFDLAIVIGVFQIIFGMILKVFNRIRQGGSFVYGLSTVGWLILILSSLVFFGYQEMNETFPQWMTGGYYASLGLGLFFILFFSNPGSNIFMNFGLGIWDIYTSVTGLLGDVLSYIRLFALGISSAILGNVFNRIAFEMSPEIPVLGHLVFVFILLFGHGINIFMASLGAFVHPMRLTFVEFYKNAGFEGGGKEYKPFAKIK